MNGKAPAPARWSRRTTALASRVAVPALRSAKAHNAKYGATKSWSYGPAYQRGVCAAASQKSPACPGGGCNSCGSNTYPTGAFPDCRSALGVYDLHGNAAEHMNLPLRPDQMASTGSTKLGVTEMKGSWFIFDTYHAHPDWCRWRAPYWHGSRVMSPPATKLPPGIPVLQDDRLTGRCSRRAVNVPRRPATGPDFAIGPSSLTIRDNSGSCMMSASARGSPLTKAVRLTSRTPWL